MAGYGMAGSYDSQENERPPGKLQCILFSPSSSHSSSCFYSFYDLRQQTRGQSCTCSQNQPVPSVEGEDRKKKTKNEGGRGGGSWFSFWFSIQVLPSQYDWLTNTNYEEPINPHYLFKNAVEAQLTPASSLKFNQSTGVITWSAEQSCVISYLFSSCFLVFSFIVLIACAHMSYCLPPLSVSSDGGGWAEGEVNSILCTLHFHDRLTLCRHGIVYFFSTFFSHL